MALTFHPKIGMVLWCDFRGGFIVPEMVKKRPVVVVSRDLPGRSDLCTVVPLSTTAPYQVQPYHHEMDPHSLPGKLALTKTWAKCDMLATVSLKRLDRVLLGRNPTAGKRIYASGQITPADLQAIRQGLQYVLSLPRK